MRDAELSGDPFAVPRRSLNAVRVAAGLYPVMLLLAAVAAFSFLSGGYILARTAPVVLACSLALLVWVWAAREIHISLRFTLALALFVAWAAWTGLSILWSVGPDLTWVAFDTALLYAAVLALSGSSPAGPLQLRLAGAGYLAVAVAIAGYAFLGKALPDVVTHAHTYARLDKPVGYWNVLALMLVMALPLALEAGSRRAHAVWVRALVAAGLVVILFAFFFSYSRGGYIALAVVLLVYFVLATERLSSLATLTVSVLPVAAVLVHLRGLKTVFSATTNDALRTAQGHVLARWSLVAIVVAVVAQVAVALVHRRLRLRQATVRIVGVVIVAGMLVTLVVGSQLAFASRGGVVHWVSVHYHDAISGKTLAGDNPGRLFSLNTGRLALWREGIKQAHKRPLLGTGSGTFRFTHYRLRQGGGVVKHAHSQWINALSETGIIGLALFVGAIGALLFCVFRRMLRDRADPRRALVAAMQAACLAFVVHLTWDWDWDMAAVSVAFLLLAGSVSGYLAGGGGAMATQLEIPEALDDDAPPPAGAETDEAESAPAPAGEQSHGPARRPGGSRRARWAGYRTPPLAARIMATGIVVLLAVSWTLPYLSGRAESRAVADAGQNKLGAAAAQARRAHRLDPLAVEPLITLSLVQQQQGLIHEALSTLLRAQGLQPQNYQVHYQVGVLLLNAFDRPAAAEQAFSAALALNPGDVMVRAQARAAAQR